MIDPFGTYPEGYTVYVDGQKTSQAEQGYWSYQLSLYDQNQTFVEAVQNAFLQQIYKDARGMYTLADKKGAAELEALGEGMNTTFSPPEKKFYNHFEETYNDVAIQIGDHTIEIEQIIYFIRGNGDARFNRVVEIGAFSNKASNSSIGGRNIAYIRGEEGGGVVDMGPGRTPINPRSSIKSLTTIGTIQLSDLEYKHYKNAARYLTRDIIERKVYELYDSQQQRKKAMRWLRHNYPRTFGD